MSPARGNPSFTTTLSSTEPTPARIADRSCSNLLLIQLSQLAEHIENGEFRAAFSLALALWREKPHAELAAFVLDLAEPAMGEKVREPLVTNEPTSLPRWLDTIFVDGNSVATLANLTSVLEKHKPDPRLFDWLVAQLAHPKFDLVAGNPRRLYRVMIETIANLEDERVRPWVERLPAFLEAHKGKRHGQLSPDEIAAAREMFADCTFRVFQLTPLTDAESAAVAAARVPLEKWRAHRRDATRRRDELFEEVIADFSDDAAKEVYADFLLEQGDKLGEYISLGLRLAREGDLPHALERRHLSLTDHARKAQPMGTRFDRGFAVEARFKDGEGNHRGSYGLELGWGTIEIADVPPTSDACHTESLRELVLGSTFIADLAKLKKPLDVLRLTWTTPSHNGQPKWRKIKVLPKLEQLTITQPGDGPLDWLLTEGPGPSVRELTIANTYNWSRHVEWVRDLFTVAPALECARLGDFLVFRREGSKVHLAMAVPDTDALQKLEAALVALPLGFVDVVTIEGPGDAATYQRLIAYGRESRIVTSRSAAADAAEATREGDTLIVDPAPDRIVFDSHALHWLLDRQKDVQRVVIRGAAQIERAADYYAVVTAAGGTELELIAALPRWHRGRFVLSVTPGLTIEAELGRDDHVAILRGAIASFSTRPARVIVRHSPYLRDPASIGEGFELISDEAVFARMFRSSVKTKRLTIEPAGTGSPLMPATLAVIFASLKSPPREVRVAQGNNIPLAPWIDWCAQTKLGITFARFTGGQSVIELSWDDGVVARANVDSSWERFAASLAPVPPNALRKLTVRCTVAAPAEAIAACARVATSVAVE
jgi:uncharacterized protein (TIGR02996 family)